MKWTKHGRFINVPKWSKKDQNENFIRNTGSITSTQNIELDIEILQHWYHLCVECPTKKNNANEVPQWFSDMTQLLLLGKLEYG